MCRVISGERGQNQTCYFITILQLFLFSGESQLDAPEIDPPFPFTPSSWKRIFANFKLILGHVQ